MIPNNRRKAKPIFAEEKEFIEEHLPEIGTLPNDCWITGGGTKFIWLDLYSKEFYLKFKCEPGGKFMILKDNRDKFRDYTQVTISETLQREKERVLKLYEMCVSRTAEFVNTHPEIPYSVSVSGGKDSELLMAVWFDTMKRIEKIPTYEFLFLNTSNEAADVYKRIKQIDGIHIANPKIGWRQWIKNNKYSFPNQFRRSCCSIYKEGQVIKLFDKEQPRVQVMGVRATESNKRAGYEFYMDYDFDVKRYGHGNLPKAWSKLAPIVDLETVDVWLLILIKNLPINRRYKLGESRVGCLICPYSSAYEDEILKKFYSHQYKWFVNAITQNYEIYKAHTLGWTLQEWIGGAWKCPKPKHLIKNLKPTPENIKSLAERKGLSEEMAAKYFDRYCDVCGKQCNENEVGMFLKLFGRYEGYEDNRNPLCKKCLCKKLNMTKAEYGEMLSDFYNQGCSLF